MVDFKTFQPGQRVVDKNFGTVGTVVRPMGELILVNLSGKNRQGQFTGEKGLCQYLPCNLQAL